MPGQFKSRLHSGIRRRSLSVQARIHWSERRHLHGLRGRLVQGHRRQRRVRRLPRELDVATIFRQRHRLPLQRRLRRPARRPVRAVCGGVLRARPRVPGVPRQLRLGARRLRRRRLPLPRRLLRPARRALPALRARELQRFRSARLHRVRDQLQHDVSRLAELSGLPLPAGLLLLLDAVQPLPQQHVQGHAQQ